ncbi:MAG: DNA adenine methylase [Oligoflexia bacterium]|nr:DNA adenine methylase [Oligoflexia bacterium]
MGQALRRPEDSEQSDTPVTCRPFLKWAGGKGRLIPELSRRIPSNFERYFEPFAGSAALFFHLQPHHTFLSDLNPELIATFAAVRDKVGEVIKLLKSYPYESAFYYKMRASDREPGFAHWSPVRRAARLIYLNKSCYNGLYRVNSHGHFNTPFGRYENPTICDADNLRACSQALQSTEIHCETFQQVLAHAGAGDFVYLDPPYMPLSSTSSFTSYYRDSFGKDMQVQLRDACVELDRKNVKFMLSNSSAPEIFELYAAFKIETVEASRAINSVAAKRGKINEVIVRNYT